MTVNDDQGCPKYSKAMHNAMWCEVLRCDCDVAKYWKVDSKLERHIVNVRRGSLESEGLQMDTKVLVEVIYGLSAHRRSLGVSAVHLAGDEKYQ
jgi:hypothetical protein